jgi:hypothetical protein
VPLNEVEGYTKHYCVRSIKFNPDKASSNLPITARFRYTHIINAL